MFLFLSKHTHTHTRKPPQEYNHDLASGLARKDNKKYNNWNGDNNGVVLNSLRNEADYYSPRMDDYNQDTTGSTENVKRFDFVVKALLSLLY